MRPLLDRFILGFPVLFLKQYPYAWIAIVALWPRSPALASLFGLADDPPALRQRRVHRRLGHHDRDVPVRRAAAGARRTRLSGALAAAA